MAIVITMVIFGIAGLLWALAAASKDDSDFEDDDNS